MKRHWYSFKEVDLKKHNIESLEGKTVVCRVATKSLTQGRNYYVQGHFGYIDSYQYVNQFLTLKNDKGYTIKVNRRKFDVYTKDAIAIMQSALPKQS